MDAQLNARGRRMLELCQEYQLVITNGCTKSDAEGNFTFVGGQGTSTNDFCAISGKWIENVDDLKIDLKNYSDHLPLVVKTRLRTQPQLENLKLLPKLHWNPTFLAAYQKKLDQITSSINPKELDIDETARKLTKAITLSSVKTSRPYEKKNEWFDLSCEKARNKSMAWLKLFRITRGENVRKIYVEMNKTYKKLCHVKKVEHIKKVSLELSTAKDSTTFWRSVKRLNGSGFKIEADLSSEILAQHFERLLTYPDMAARIQYAPNFITDELLDSDMQMDELYKVIAKAKLNKAPGYDRIPYEFYKNATDTFLAKVLEFFNTIWAREIIPDSFKQAILFPILKKGDASNPENYRGISFLNSMAKMFAGVILNRLEQFTERGNLLSEAQAGFRPGYSTIDHIFTLENMFHLAVKRGKKMYAVFVDLKAAFDHVSRTALIYKLRILGISTKMVNIIEKLYDTTTASVWNGYNLSEWFGTTTGVRQGCILSPLLFALFLNDIVEWLPGGINIGDVVIKILLYADDICMFAESVDMLQVMLNRLAEYCKTWGLEVNLSKTKVVIFNKHRGRMARNEKWFFNGGPVEVVKEYKYLGIIVTPQMNLKSHLDEKLKVSMNAVNATWAKILKTQEVSHSAKFKIFTAAVKSIMLYGAEVWGNQPYDQVEKLLIFFIKRYFWLPVNTPNYMVMLETGLPPLFIDTLKAHYDYLLKVLKYPQERLAYKTMVAAREKNIGFHYRLQEMAEKYQVTVDLHRDEICIREQLSEIIRKVDLQRRQDYTNLARNSQSRFLYSSLNYDLGRLNYFKDNFTRAQIALIFKTRGELLNLNYHPYKKTDSLECNLCNMRAREDVLHFIGKCPILREIRLLHLGKAILSLHETLDVLNGNDWTALTNYCFEASGFRTDYT